MIAVAIEIRLEDLRHLSLNVCFDACWYSSMLVCKRQSVHMLGEACGKRLALLTRVSVKVFHFVPLYMIKYDVAFRTCYWNQLIVLIGYMVFAFAVKMFGFGILIQVI